MSTQASRAKLRDTAREKKVLARQLVLVIRDTRDANKDFQLPRYIAEEAYAAGKLSWSVTNSEYCVTDKTPVFGPADYDSWLKLLGIKKI